MKLENTKNTTRNIATGLISTILMIVLQFVFRTVFIRRLGAEYLGLNSLFGSVLDVLNLAELGISASITFCMYKPIAEDDNERICALMLFYKRCYEIIGLIILGGGLAVLPFLKFVIKGDIPADMNVYALYLLVLANTVLSYYLFSYKNCLLTAYQRIDIKNNLSIFLALIQYSLQIALLYIIRNYYIYLITNIVFTVIGNFATAWSVDRQFPKLRARGKLEQDTKNTVISQVKAMVLYKISGVISNSLDSVIVSSFLGLVLLGKLNNYLYIASSVGSIIAIYTNAMTAGIGNNLVLHSREQNYKDYSVLSFVHSWLIGWCTVCVLCLAQPFITIWAGKGFLLSMDNVVFIAIYFYVARMVDITNVFRQAVGIWNSDKIRPVISACFNLVINLILVRYWGIDGVLFSTIAATIIFDVGWGTVVLIKKCFDVDLKHFYVKQLLFSLSTVAASALTLFVTIHIPLTGVLNGILLIAACVIVPNAVFLLIFSRMPDFKEAVAFLLKTFRVIKVKFFPVVGQ